MTPRKFMQKFFTDGISVHNDIWVNTLMRVQTAILENCMSQDTILRMPYLMIMFSRT
jgi:hypothetical protein